MYKMLQQFLCVSSLILSLVVSKPFERHQLKTREFVEIEAVHLIDTPLGVQIVHAVVPLSTVPVEEALASESVWYIPEQQEFPKLGYLTSHGWFFLHEHNFQKIKKRAFAKKAPKNAQLDVTSLVRLVPSSFENVQFIRKGPMGAYIYSDGGSQKNSQFEAVPSASTRTTDTQVVKTGNLAAYIYTEVPEPQSFIPGDESLYWLIPAVPSSQSKTPRSYTTRLHDSSLLLYHGMPRLIKLKA